MITVTFDPSVADITVDKIRIDTPILTLIYPKAFLQAAVADGTDYIVTVTGGANAAELGGVSANKSVDGVYGVSSARKTNPATSVSDQNGAIYVTKNNPATYSGEWKTDGNLKDIHYTEHTVTVNFTDIENLTAAEREAVTYLASQGIILGESAAVFGPDDNITRIQLAIEIVKAIGPVDMNADGYFSDIGRNDSNRPYAGTAKNAGIISGYTDGTFKPDITITKDQIVAIAARTLWGEMRYTSDPGFEQYAGRFTDADSIPVWARSDIAKAESKALFPHTSSGAFSPSSDMTRAGAAVIVKRLIDYLWA